MKKIKDYIITMCGGVIREKYNEAVKIINCYENSDKIVKDCVIYTKLPLTVNKENIVFMKCSFEGLKFNADNTELLEMFNTQE